MTTTSNTGTLTPVIGSELTVATITGGPFDLVSAFAQGGNSPDNLGRLTYRLYSLVGGLATLVAESTVLGSQTPALLQFPLVRGFDASQITGSSENVTSRVQAGGTSYMLTVTALPTPPTASQVRLPATATLAGTELLAVAGNTNISPVLVAPPYTEASSPTIVGFAQLMDVALNQSAIPLSLPSGGASSTNSSPAPGGVVVKVFASNGVGSVEAEVAQVSIPSGGNGSDGVSDVLRAVKLPVASSYRVSLLNNTSSSLTTPLGVATYSLTATAGSRVLAPLGGSIGVTGPANANHILPVAPLAGEVILTIAGASSWQSAVGVLSPPGTDNPYWDQASWFVDPQNVTGLASDANSGIDALHPVLSYNGGIATKWGTYSPRLRVNTTITWLSSQLVAGDPVILTPVFDVIPPAIVGVYLTLTGVLGAAQQVAAGLLAGVIAKNRPAVQLLTANLGASCPPGTLLHNTTKDSWAWVYELVSGTTYTISQPMATVLPLPIVLFNATEDDTWTNGDAFVAYEPCSVNLVNLVPTIATYDAGFLGQMQALNLVFSGFAGLNSASVHIQDETSIAQCRFDKPINDDTFNDVVTTGFTNCFAKAGLVSSNAADVFSVWQAGVILNGKTTGFAFDFDAIVNCGAGMIFRSPFTDPVGTGNQIGFMYIAGKSIWNGTWNFFSGYINPPLVWGPGVFEAQGAGTRISYSAARTAVVTWQNLGGLLIDDQTQASTFDTLTSLWAGPFPMTAASLDNPAQLNGLAVNNGGASYSGQGTP